MLDILEALFTQYGYAAVFVVLVACGFGIPIPEDITLIAGGVISGLGHSNAHIMVVVGMIGVLTGDGMMFLLGHFYGDRILKARFVKRLMPPQRYLQVQEKFDKHGSWVLFVARFLPGLRTPIYVPHTGAELYDLFATERTSPRGLLLNRWVHPLRTALRLLTPRAVPFAGACRTPRPPQPVRGRPHLAAATRRSKWPRVR